jgi:hypothetical protein
MIWRWSRIGSDPDLVSFVPSSPSSHSLRPSRFPCVACAVPLLSSLLLRSRCTLYALLAFFPLCRYIRLSLCFSFAVSLYTSFLPAFVAAAASSCCLASLHYCTSLSIRLRRTRRCLPILFALFYVCAVLRFFCFFVFTPPSRPLSHVRVPCDGSFPVN